MKKSFMRKLAENLKLWLARRRLVIVAEVIDREKNIYKVYCPKCKTWHTTHLSGYPGNEHYHLPCGETIFV